MTADPQQPQRQPFLRIPAATLGLIVVLVVVHAARVLAPAALSNEIVADFAFYPARYSHAFLVAHSMDPGTIWARAIPFVSYIFLHANFTHLAVNCVWMLPFGSIIARRFGAMLFFVFFLVCGIGGAVAHLLTEWGSTDYALGASAAISGLMAAGFRIIVPLDFRDIQAFSQTIGGKLPAPTALAPLASRRLLLWSAIFVALNITVGRYGLGVAPGTGIVAWQAHIGGYATGLVLATPFDRTSQWLRFGRLPSKAG